MHTAREKTDRQEDHHLNQYYCIIIIIYGL